MVPPGQPELGSIAMHSLNRVHGTLAAAIAALLSTGTARADIDDLVPLNLPMTFSGSYLAGRSADIAKDIGTAVAFYDDAIEIDPENPMLVERLQLLSLATGDFEQGFPLSEEILDTDQSNAVARLALAVRAFGKADYAGAQEQLAAVAAGPLPDLIAGLVTAWAQFGEGNVDQALETIDGLSGPSWYASFKDLHAALIQDAAGRAKDAVDTITRAYEYDQTLSVVLAYARINARAGMTDDAVNALRATGEAAPMDPTVTDLLAQIEAGSEIAPVAADAQQGAAQVLFNLGAALSTDEGPEQPAAYLALAGFLDPALTEVKRQLGRVYAAAGRCEDAIPIFEAIPADNILRHDADMQIGTCLATLDRTDEAVAYLQRAVESNPGDVEAATELGNVYRWAERYPEAAVAYTAAIDALGEPTAADWRTFYFRGVSYVFADDWGSAEADFERALELSPNQPDVLNFLGYSWVDMGLHLDRAVDMIRTAVELRPRSGYIVDSLGWAYFQLGRYDEAVTALEHALELESSDSTLFDHLGDAYWMVGRKREAMFQWAHARDYNPDASALDRILLKLEVGLDKANLQLSADSPPG
jgi:tetratricopeptide (TPR) repeat protein